MARTKMEVDAITTKVRNIILEVIDKRIKDKIPEAKKLFDKKLKGLYKERISLDKKITLEAKKLGIAGTYNSDKQAVDIIAERLAKIKYPNHGKIEMEVILAGDQGADVLIKNIVKMFV